jgi:hypothetical protein
MTDSALHSERDLTHSISVPVLASLPYVMDPKEKRQAMKRRWLITAATCGSILMTVLLAYLERSAIATGLGWRF